LRAPSMINYGASYLTIVIQNQNLWRLMQITLICIERLMLFVLFYVNVYHLVLLSSELRLGFVLETSWNIESSFHDKLWSITPDHHYSQLKILKVDANNFDLYRDAYAFHVILCQCLSSCAGEVYKGMICDGCCFKVSSLC